MTRSESSFREDQQRAFEGRVVAAAIALLQEGEPVTFGAVARRAGVAERTLYRRYATKDELERAVWGAVTRRYGGGFPTRREGLGAHLREIFEAFERDPALMRALLRSDAGSTVRRAAGSEREAAFESLVATARPDLDPAERRRRAAAIQVLHSAPAWEMLHDFWSMDAANAATTVAAAIDAVLDAPPPEPER